MVGGLVEDLPVSRWSVSGGLVEDLPVGWWFVVCRWPAVLQYALEKHFFLIFFLSFENK